MNDREQAILVAALQCYLDILNDALTEVMCFDDVETALSRLNSIEERQIAFRQLRTEQYKIIGNLFGCAKLLTKLENGIGL